MSHLSLDQINFEITKINQEIIDLNVKRDNLLEKRKEKALLFIKENQIKAEDFDDFENTIKARVEEALRARDESARIEALNNPPPPPALAPGGKKPKVNPKISLPAGEYDYKINGKNIMHGGKRPSVDLEEIINGPVIDTSTGKRDPSQRKMSRDDFLLLLIKKQEETSNETPPAE